MKHKYFIGALLVLFAGVQIPVTMTTQRTEHQAYRKLFQDGNFEIRAYPAALTTYVEHDSPTLRGSSTSNFRRLAGYIFGNNQSGQQIAMTAPVHMEPHDGGTRMRFVVPSGMSRADLPVPMDAGVLFETLPADTVAVLRFGGFSSDSKFRRKKEQLMQLLKARALPSRGEFRYLGYNPPYQLFGRRNEVIVSVEWPHR
jgi:hypothetical protein